MVMPLCRIHQPTCLSHGRPECRRSLEQRRTFGRSHLRPAVPPVRIIVMNANADPRSPPDFRAVQPRRIQPQHDRPADRIVLRLHLPAATAARGSHPPIRIVERRLPAAGAPAVHHAAVEHPLQRPLEVIVRRRRRPITSHIEADRHCIGPRAAAIGYQDRDEYRVGSTQQPDPGVALASADPDLRKTPGCAVDPAVGRGRMGDHSELDRVRECAGRHLQRDCQRGED